MVSAGAFFEDRAPFNSNADLYNGLSDSSMVRTAVQPGIGDTYGGSVFNHTDLIGTEAASRGVVSGTGNAYGSPIPNVEQGTLNW